MLPSSSPETGRDPWADGAPPGDAAPRGGPAASEDGPRRRGPRRLRRGGAARRVADDDGTDTEPDEESEPPVEVRRDLSLAVGGFAALLGIGLVIGAQTAGPGHRLPFALVVLAVQVLYVFAAVMAAAPPATLVVAVVAVAAAVGADILAVQSDTARLLPLTWVALGGVAVAVLGQLVRRVDRARVTDSLRTTAAIVLGAVALATLLVLGRHPAGTQAITVCFTAATVALTVARVTDAFAAWPRLAPQVPRGAAGVVAGAMVGTLVSAVLGSYLVLPFTPTRAALIGLVAAVTAVLADLASGYAEAGRLMAGEPPTMWVTRHMQGPLAGVALAAPTAYAMSRLVL